MSEVNPSTSPVPRRGDFFRQSGWLMMATMAGGVFMWAVHFLSKGISPEDYGLFVSALAVMACVPILPLQMVLTQQAARAQTAGTDGQISSLLRKLLWITLGLAALLAAGVVLGQAALEKNLHLPNATDLWLLVAILFFSVWLPILSGVLQGRQNFLWLGWVLILTAVGRFGGAAVLVLVLGWRAGGMLTGVLLGALTGVFIGLVHSRPVWGRRPEPFPAGPMLAQITPLLLGFGAVQFLFTADTLFVKAFFSPDETGYYGGAGTLARALLWAVQPLTQVMFPKLVQSSARKEKSNLMTQVLLGTLAIAVAGALGLILLRHPLIRLVFKPEFESVGAAVLPWYAAAIVPLALANVLANAVLARGEFRVVPALVALGLGYGVTLYFCHASLVQVLQIMGTFNLLLLAVCAWFHRSRPAKSA